MSLAAKIDHSANSGIKIVAYTAFDCSCGNSEQHALQEVCGPASAPKVDNPDRQHGAHEKSEECHLHG